MVAFIPEVRQCSHRFQGEGVLVRQVGLERFGVYPVGWWATGWYSVQTQRFRSYQHICDTQGPSVKENPPKKGYTEKLESRAPRTSIGGYKELSGQWRKEGCWEGEKEQPERLLKNKKIGITQIKQGRVQEGMMNSMRRDKIQASND